LNALFCTRFFGRRNLRAALRRTVLAVGWRLLAAGAP